MKRSKPKTLPSSKRDNKRYVVYEVVSENTISIEDLSNAIWFSALNYLGELGAGRAGIMVIKDVYENNRGLVKCNHNSTEEVKAALTLINRIGEAPLIIKILGVAGTIDSAKKKYFK